MYREKNEGLSPRTAVNSFTQRSVSNVVKNLLFQAIVKNFVRLNVAMLLDKTKSRKQGKRNGETIFIGKEAVLCAVNLSGPHTVNNSYVLKRVGKSTIAKRHWNFTIRNKPKRTRLKKKVRK